MEQYKYACDGGCLAIRTESGTSYYHNGYGDAEHDVFVITDAEQFPIEGFVLLVILIFLKARLPKF